MVSIELDSAEGEKDTIETAENEKPKFPLGTTITLDDDLIKKLGIKKMPEIGDQFSIEGIAHVTSVSNYESQETSHRQICIQFSEMSCAGYKEDYFKKVGKKIYGK
ncbi:MAG: capsid staple protein [Rhabdochlamydiaceae bacterium]